MMGIKEELQEIGMLGEEIRDAVFGELVLSKDIGMGFGEETVVFGGGEVSARLVISAQDSECSSCPFTEGQYEAYKRLKARWGEIEQQVMEAILRYYIKTRKELGYAEEEHEDYPEIRTISQLQKHIELREIRIDPESFFNGRRSVGLGFGCSWDDYNGVGVQLLEETVHDIGYMDIIW